MGASSPSAGGGTSKLWSAVNINADKPMLGFGLESVKELAAGMTKGDILCSDGTRLAIVSPGVKGTELLTKGTFFPPVWGFPDTGG